jgi:hypothetical protein
MFGADGVGGESVGMQQHSGTPLGGHHPVVLGQVGVVPAGRLVNIT